MTVRHVILDRDGVLNREVPGGWTTDYAQWTWEEGALEALRRLAEARVVVSVVTNQSCIGRGLVGPDAVDELHRRMREEVTAHGGRIDAVLVCPHTAEDACGCRKPEPGLVLAALAAAGVAPTDTLLVGDDTRDLEAGRRAGVRVALVRTGKGGAAAGELPSDPPTPVFDDLAAVVGWLLAGGGAL